jgi:hypothetical protein
MEEMISDRIKAHRSAPDVYDPPTFDQMADRIEELEAKLDWVIVERDETFALMLDRAQTAEAKLAKAVDVDMIEQAISDVMSEGGTYRDAAEYVARTTLAELKGEKQ